MNRRTNHAGKLSIAGGAAMLFGGGKLLRVILGPARCRDGWHSSSIGSRGACSWHGGVDNSAGFFFLLLLVASIAFGFWLYGKLENRATLPPLEPAFHKCLECGITLADHNTGQDVSRCATCSADENAGQGKGDARPAPKCPDCGGGMVERTARNGKWAGQRFLGCRRYPRCRGIRPAAGEQSGASSDV